MKNQYLTSLLFLFFILNSCQSKPKPEPKQKPMINYTIQNYKLDDDEMEKRKLADSLAKENLSKEQEVDSLHTTQK